MGPTVGVPRGLLFHEFFPLWQELLSSLGATVVVSEETNETILNAGVRTCVDEACLPVKVFFGHASALTGKVDALFIPRIVSVERSSFICPKLMGLPDMVRACLPKAPRVLDPCVDLSKSGIGFAANLARLGREFGANPARTVLAFGRGLARLRREEARFRARTRDMARNLQDLAIGVLGHRYNLDDAYMSMNIKERLVALGATPVTDRWYSDRELSAWARSRPGRKVPFWTPGKRIIGTAQRWLESREVDGIIHLTSFGCGPESFIAELVQREATRRRSVPFMLLSLDEHTGEAGVATRLEAFIDTVWMRKTGRED
ncbi:MAG: acyl-CoA dehydratase activase-related protein [Firmicutes bacterium]|jgi:predicted nucleotide-binding protein (sugar kinase/HSP70/actin superfamily)|nr:acyl-CoA dehydratase activase-related protein [Bacillota bacterium]